jgi:hypothetical protein
MNKKYVFMQDYFGHYGDPNIPKYSTIGQDEGSRWIIKGGGEEFMIIHASEKEVLDKYGNHIAEIEDITPTWSNLILLYLDIVREGDKDSEGYKGVIKEIHKMAQLADKYVEYVKSKKTPGPKD